jgi:hypothetical protein
MIRQCSGASTRTGGHNAISTFGTQNATSIFGINEPVIPANTLPATKIASSICGFNIDSLRY